jgi:hypothetical protein
VGDGDDGVDVASGLVVGFDRHLQGIAGRHEVVEDLVGGLFVGNVAIAVVIDIELDRLEFYDLLVRHVGDIDSGEVRVAREGAFAGELGQGDADFVAATGARVGEGDEIAFGYCPFTVLNGFGAGGRGGVLVLEGGHRRWCSWEQLWYRMIISDFEGRWAALGGGPKKSRTTREIFSRILGNQPMFLSVFYLLSLFVPYSLCLSFDYANPKNGGCSYHWNSQQVVVHYFCANECVPRGFDRSARHPE